MLIQFDFVKMCELC